MDFWPTQASVIGSRLDCFGCSQLDLRVAKAQISLDFQINQPLSDRENFFIHRLNYSLFLISDLELHSRFLPELNSVATEEAKRQFEDLVWGPGGVFNPNWYNESKLT